MTEGLTSANGIRTEEISNANAQSHKERALPGDIRILEPLTIWGRGGGICTPTSMSAAPAGCPTIQRNSDTVKGSVPQDCPTLNLTCQSQVPDSHPCF